MLDCLRLCKAQLKIGNHPMMKKKPKMIVMLSFKEFLIDKDEDEKKIRCVQELQNQTYKDILYVVTIFNEKNVENCLLPHIKDKNKWIFKHSKLIHDRYKFSVTDMVINGLDEAFKYDDAMCIIFNSDNIWEKHFIEVIANKYEKKISGMAARHRIYKSLDDFGTKNYKYTDAVHMDGFMETIFFSADIFKEKEAYDDLLRYRIEGWGATEWFYMSVFQRKASKMINLYYYDSIYKMYEEKDESTLSRERRNDVKNRAVTRAYRKYYQMKTDVFHYAPLVLAYKDIPFKYRLKFLLLSGNALIYRANEYGYVNTALCAARYLKG